MSIIKSDITWCGYTESGLLDEFSIEAYSFKVFDLESTEFRELLSAMASSILPSEEAYFNDRLFIYTTLLRIQEE